MCGVSDTETGDPELAPVAGGMLVDVGMSSQVQNCARLFDADLV